MSDDARFNSVRERIKARREELRQSKTLDLSVPGYDGELGVRYRAIDDEEFGKLAKKIGRGNSTDLKAAVDLLIKACDSILIREGEKFEPLVDEEDDPVRFDIRLAEFLGLSADTASAIVREVFSPEGNQPLAPGTHGLAVVQWMQGDASKIDEELLGE